MTIEEQLTEILAEETAVDQDELIERINAPADKILKTLHDLMEDGKISYDIEWRIDGRGKDYTDGLIEE